MSCCCIPLQFALMLVLTFAPCAGGVFLPSTGANTPLAHVVVSSCCNLRWWCFSSSSWRKYSTYTCGGHHPLQLALVVFFLPTTGANTLLALVQLALCGGGYMKHTHHRLRSDRFSLSFLSETPPDPPGLWSIPWEVPERVSLTKLPRSQEERRVSSSGYLYVQDAPCFSMFDPCF